ncbi:MAG: photosystem I reaction center subunit PsaK [Cyanobacteria bacterium P01_H01_bin.15]
MNSFFLLATAVPNTISWGPQVALVMILCNILAIALGKAVIKDVGAGPTFPKPYRAFFGDMGWPALLATTSLGHIIGVGAILGLASTGLL